MSIDYIDVDKAIELGVIGRTEITCNGEVVKKVIEASVSGGYVVYYDDPLTFCSGEIDKLVKHGDVEIAIHI